MDDLVNTSKKLVERLIEKDLRITSMESCTGGYFLSSITDIENASKVTDGGYVTYANRSKIANGVSEECIKEFGVYSKETAIEMSKACKLNSFNINKLIGVGITGTLTRIDGENVGAGFHTCPMGKIFYAINYPDGKIVTNEITLDANIPRHEMKKFIVTIIMKEIIKCPIGDVC